MYGLCRIRHEVQAVREGASVIFGRNKVLDELKILNLHLALIAEVLQNPHEPHSRYTPPTPKVSPVETKVEFPPALVDASELLARWLWLQLPEESKKDLMP